MSVRAKTGCVAVTSALFWGLGCGSGGSPSPIHDGGPSDAPGAPSGGDAADGGNPACSADGGAAGPAAVAAQSSGRLVFRQGWDIDGDLGAVFQARFFHAGQPLYPPPGREDFSVAGGLTEPPGVCVVMTVGACTVFTTNCDIPVQAACPAPQAGALTLNDETSMSDLGVARPNASGRYIDDNFLTGAVSYPSTAAALVPDGDSFMVSAAGGDVPAFDIGVASPGCIALTAPAGPTDRLTNPLASISISTSQDLSVSWTGGEPEATVGLDLTGGPADGTGFVDVSCTFPASDGEGTVPQAALATLSAGGGQLTVYQQRSTSRQIGAFQIELDVRNLGGGVLAPDGGATSDGGATPDGGVCPNNNTLVSYE